MNRTIAGHQKAVEGSSGSTNTTFRFGASFRICAGGIEDLLITFQHEVIMMDDEFVNQFLARFGTGVPERDVRLPSSGGWPDLASFQPRMNHGIWVNGVAFEESEEEEGEIEEDDIEVGGNVAKKRRKRRKKQNGGRMEASQSMRETHEYEPLKRPKLDGEYGNKNMCSTDVSPDATLIAEAPFIGPIQPTPANSENGDYMDGSEDGEIIIE